MLSDDIEVEKPNKQSSERAKAIENRRKAWELRKAGASYWEIADALNVGYHAAYGYVKKVIRDLEPDKDEVEEARRIELERIDRMVRAVYPAALKGHLGAVDRVIRLIHLRTSIFPGLMAPRPIAPVSPDGKEAYKGGVLVAPGVLSMDDWLEMVNNQTASDVDFDNKDHQGNGRNGHDHDL